METTRLQSTIAQTHSPTSCSPRGGRYSPSDCISHPMSLSWIALSDKCVSPEVEGEDVAYKIHKHNLCTSLDKGLRIMARWMEEMWWYNQLLIALWAKM